ncbi:MAG TPA: hypothetical protein VFY87_29520 [Geminicoccaceae bacterium]|nr:hypothetical protein [Geminicoccaceae bacterium]
MEQTLIMLAAALVLGERAGRRLIGLLALVTAGLALVAAGFAPGEAIRPAQLAGGALITTAAALAGRTWPPPNAEAEEPRA